MFRGGICDSWIALSEFIGSIFESLSHCVFIFQQSMAAVSSTDHGTIPILKFLQRDHTTPNPTLFGVQLHDIGHEFLCNWISSDCALRFFYYHL